MARKRFFVSALLFALQVNALNYGYHPDSALSLGLGFSPLDLSVTKPRCIDFDGHDHLGVDGSPETNIDITIINSQKDLYNKLGFSAEASAQTFFASGSAKASFLDEYEFHEDNTHFAIIAWTDHGRRALQNPRLKAQFQSLIDEGKYADFARRCGTHYVFEENRMSKVFAIYTIRKLSEDKKRKFDVSFEAKVNFGDAKLNATLDNFAHEEVKMNNVSLRVFAIGGSGLADLSSMVTDHMEPSRVKEVLREYLKTMTVRNAVPSRFRAGSMEDFGWIDSEPVSNLKRDSVLKEYFFLLKGISDKKSRLNELLLARDTTYAHLGDAKIQEYISASGKLADDFDNLSLDAGKCFDDAKKCSVPRYRPENIKWPTDANDFNKEGRIFLMKGGDPAAYEEPMFTKSTCDRQRTAAFMSGCVAVDEMRDLRVLNVAPLCDDEGKLLSIGSCE